MARTYRIDDEPVPGTLAQYAVHPMLTLFSLMLAGAWAAWPWSVLNAHALGSPSRRKESLLIGVCGVGALVMSVAIVMLHEEKLLEGVALRFAMLALTVWKLAFGYFLFNMQSRTFELFTWFGGSTRNAVIPLILLIFIRSRILGALPHDILVLWLM